MKLYNKNYYKIRKYFDNQKTFIIMFNSLTIGIMIVNQLKNY